jgi:hypothetical protein
MSDYEFEDDDEQLEMSDDEVLEDMTYTEICYSEVEEPVITELDQIYTEIEESLIEDKNKIHYLMDKIINIDDIKKAKDKYLYMPKYNELLAIYLNYNALLHKGSVPFLDENILKKKYNINLFNNPSFTPEIASMISLIIMNIPICIKKYNNLYDRDIDDINKLDKDYIIGYYYIVKNMLKSITYNLNNVFDFSLFGKIFPEFTKNIHNDIITDKELNEISDVKINLTNISSIPTLIH